MNRKKEILIIVLLLVLSQWLMVKMVYSHKISGVGAEFLASVYQLKAGIIEDEGGNINIYLKDFLIDKNFANKLLVAESISNNQFTSLDISDEEVSELVWDKLLKKAWLKKIALENDITVDSEDIDGYIKAVGGQNKLEELVKDQGVSIEEYKHFLIKTDILEVKVYNYFLANFADEKGVLKVQEAYTLLEVENGQNWDEVVKLYGEDTRLSDNSFWLAEEELVGVYEAIKEIEPGGFSKIVQVPIGYVIWHLDSISNDEDKEMREVRGLFIYAQGIDDFFDAYLDTVNVKRKY